MIIIKRWATRGQKEDNNTFFVNALFTIQEKHRRPTALRSNVEARETATILLFLLLLPRSN